MMRVNRDRVSVKFIVGSVLVFLMAVSAGDLRGG
jgi:hypothetical protein